MFKNIEIPNYLKKIYYTILFLSFVITLKSQDVVYTQTFGSPIYLNPAFTGNLAKTSFYLNARQQYPKISGSYASSSFTVNHRLDDINSGLGIMIKQDDEGAAKFTHTNLSAIYSYILPINNDWIVSSALQASWLNSRFNRSTFIFGDQINDDFSISETTSDAINLPTANLVDVSAGFVAYNKDFWIGIASHHLTEPQNVNSSTSLNRKFSLHAGYQFSQRFRNLSDEVIFSPNFNINTQAGFLRINTNMIITYMVFSFGTGISNLTNSFSDNNITNSYLLFGYADDRFQVGYSYDFTLLGGVGFGGAHEITLGVLLNYDNNFRKKSLKKKKIRKVSCPRF